MTKGTMLSPSSRSPNGDHAAFEARVVAAAELRPGVKGSAKTALAGADDLCAAITDDEYRHHLQDLFEALARVDGLTVFWGTTGCSLRVAIPGRGPLSIGWIFPPGPPRWMGLTDVTLGWYEDANGVIVSEPGRAGLDAYLQTLGVLAGAIKPRASAIRGWTFPPAIPTHSRKPSGQPPPRCWRPDHAPSSQSGS